MQPHHYTSHRHSSPAVPYISSLSSHYSPQHRSSHSMSSHTPHLSQIPLSPTIAQLQGERSSSERGSSWGESQLRSVRRISESGRSSFRGTELSPEVRHWTPSSTPIPRTIPLPSQLPPCGSSTVVVHAALAFERNDETVSMEMDASTSSLATNLSLAVDPRSLNEPATYPPVPSINVVHPALLWSITVHPTNGAVRYVTVSDVLCAIHQSLRIPLNEEHWPSVALVHRRRLDPRLKRLHLLHGKTTFVGLSRSPAEEVVGAEIWRMHFV